MKKYVILAVKILLIVLCSVLLGFGLLMLVHSIPSEAIKNNLVESTNIFKEEGTYPRIFNWCTSVLDNFTDATILLTTAYDGEESSFDKSLKAYRYVSNTNPDETFVNYYTDKENYEFSKTDYPRYWHGYMVILKPLLTFMNYGQIRWLNLFLQTFINIAIVVLMYKKNLAKYIAPYLISVFMIMPLATAYSLQYATIFYIFSLAMLVLLYFFDKWKNNKNIFSIMFAIIGILTAYFDFLTYPLATFGMVITLYFCMNDSQNLVDNLKDFFTYIICWGIGYVGMWGGKWILTTLFTDMNGIQNAFSTMLYWTSSETANGKITIFGMLSRVFNYFTNTPVMAAGILFIFYKIIKMLELGVKFNKSYFIMFLIIAILPIAWYIFAINHSNNHAFFTHKTLIVMVFAILCMFANLVSTKKKKR